MVQGPTIEDELRSHLMHLSSSNIFLRMALTTKWGLYAWEQLDSFSVDNHLLFSPNLYKGRAITDLNIQVSKYLNP